MTIERESAKDPVCGMDVVVDDARRAGLVSRYHDQEYVFCGRGCKLEFDDGPERYLSPDHVPTM